LPRWDLSVFFPSIDSPELRASIEELIVDIDGLVAAVNELASTGVASLPLTDDAINAIDGMLYRFNAVLDTYETIEAYLFGFIATDSRDDAAQALHSELEQRALPLSQLYPVLISWLGTVDLDDLVARSMVARDHEFVLRRYQELSRHLMSTAEEKLAVELHLSGGSAWEKLHSNVTSQIELTIDLDGDTKSLPMSEIRNLAYDEDRDVRRRAYEAELSAWERSAVPLAAALNGIKGEATTLNTRRNWADPVDLACFQNHIDHQILDAMMDAAREAFPDFRRYLRAKAHFFGADALAWYDLFAPLPFATREWSYEEAQEFIVEQFGTFSGRMRGLAERAFNESWIDVGSRPGKVDGAFCMTVRGGDSRVLMNYSPSYGSVTTLAHELGHSYHAYALGERSALQRMTPSTLAETASIFCETIVKEAALKGASPAEEIVILENALQESTQTVIDISIRFLFEQRVFAARTSRELSIDEFNELMLDAQRETYGDGLDQDTLHPYMWAVKGHYYSSSDGFYNFPYMFGLLFGLGLYARYTQDPSFTTYYDDLLSSTGLADAATLADRFGIDVRTPAFWRSSFDIIRAQIDRFVSLTEDGRSLPS
jgi:oligoendopeptidase F